jgi:hypothetical protein
MVSFVIIELEDGLTLATVQPGQDPEEAAMSQGGVLVDAGPFTSYEEAYDALVELEGEDEDEQA